MKIKISAFKIVALASLLSFAGTVSKAAVALDSNTADGVVSLAQTDNVTSANARAQNNFFRAFPGVTINSRPAINTPGWYYAVAYNPKSKKIILANSPSGQGPANSLALKAAGPESKLWSTASRRDNGSSFAVTARLY
jgi:hypothetical protein